MGRLTVEGVLHALTKVLLSETPDHIKIDDIRTIIVDHILKLNNEYENQRE